MSAAAVVIPVAGPVYPLDLGDDHYNTLRRHVGGYLEAIPVPEFVDPSGRTTCYIDEEGKLNRQPPNMRATDFLVPGVGLHWGDYIAGPMVVVGFDPDTGEEVDLSAQVALRIAKIEREAG